MILLYNWQIYDYPIPSSQPLIKYITQPKPSILEQPSSQSLNISIHPITLKSPIFSVVFCYLLEDTKSSNPQIHLFPELTLFDSKIQISLLEERRERNCIYQLIKIENCQCFDTMITFCSKVKYIEGHSSKVNTIDKLINLVGSRKLNSHSFHTHSIIKKELSIEEPVTAELRYSPKGYMIIKLTRGEQFNSNLWIENIEALTWLSQNQIVKNFQTKNIAENNKIIKLAPKQVYSFMFMLPPNLKGSIQIPISVTFCFDFLNDQKFKIIKYLKIE